MFSQVGHVLEKASGELFYTALTKVEMLLGKNAIDGRLAMQYAVSLVSAEEVYAFVNIVFYAIYIMLLHVL